MGSRGLGKTVMLNEFEDAALRAGWLAVSESSSPGLLQRLTRDHLPRLLREHARPRARLTGLSATPGPLDVGAAWEPGPPPESTLRAQINELTDRLADQGGGLALTVDEIQDADVAELRKIGEVLQFSRREGRALAFAGAGLRTGVGALVRSPGATFLRRAMRSLPPSLPPAPIYFLCKRWATAQTLWLTTASICSPLFPKRRSASKSPSTPPD